MLASDWQVSSPSQKKFHPLPKTAEAEHVQSHSSETPESGEPRGADWRVGEGERDQRETKEQKEKPKKAEKTGLGRPPSPRGSGGAGERGSGGEREPESGRAGPGEESAGPGRARRAAAHHGQGSSGLCPHPSRGRRRKRERPRAPTPPRPAAGARQALTREDHGGGRSAPSVAARAAPGAAALPSRARTFRSCHPLATPQLQGCAGGGALGRISRETLTGMRGCGGGTRPSPAAALEPPRLRGRIRDPRPPPPCAPRAASRDPVGGREGPRGSLRPDAAGKLGGQPGLGAGGAEGPGSPRPAWSRCFQPRRSLLLRGREEAVWRSPKA